MDERDGVRMFSWTSERELEWRRTGVTEAVGLFPWEGSNGDSPDSLREAGKAGHLGKLDELEKLELETWTGRLERDRQKELLDWGAGPGMTRR